MSKLKIKNKYSTIPNSLLNDKNISLKAKGLFAYLQGKPEHWKFSKDRMVSQLKEGLSSIKSCIKELKEYGYLKTVPIKNEVGKFIGQDYLLDDKPSVGKPTLRKTRTTENHTCISNKDLSKKDSSKKDINNIAKTSFAKNETNKILDIFYDYNPAINFGNKTQRQAIDFFIRKYGVEDTINIVTLALQNQSEQFCPVITTPLQLKNKFGDLRAFLDRKKKAEEVQLVPEF